MRFKSCVYLLSKLKMSVSKPAKKSPIEMPFAGIQTMQLCIAYVHNVPCVVGKDKTY